MSAFLTASVSSDGSLVSDLCVPRLDIDDLFWPAAWEQQQFSPVDSCDAVDMDIFGSYLDELVLLESVEPSDLKDVHFVVEAQCETKATLKRKRVETEAHSRASKRTTAPARQLKARKRVSTSVRVREEKKALRSMIEQLELELEDLSNNRETRVSRIPEQSEELPACDEATLALENACLRELVASQRKVIARAESLITQSWQPLNVTLEHALY